MLPPPFTLPPNLLPNTGFQAMLPLYSQMAWWQLASLQGLSLNQPHLKEWQAWCRSLGLPEFPELTTLDASTAKDVAQEATRHYQQVTQGLTLLTTALTSHFTPPTPPEILWQHGAARLWHYPAAPNTAPQVPVFLIPSLINRAYIFGVHQEQSFVEYLTSRGHSVAVLDWGAPTEHEQHWNAADYLHKALLPALAQVHTHHHRPPALLGYCMGGLFALAAVQHQPNQSAGLVLLATPWDFRVPDAHPWAQHPFVTQGTEQWLQEMMKQCIVMPGSIIHALMYFRDPWKIHRQFAHFAALPAGSVDAQRFILRQRWIHDHIPLTHPMTRSAFLDWGTHNQLAAGTYRWGDAPLQPASIAHKTLLVMPQYDSVVPATSSAPLAAMLPHVQLLKPALGHVGMMLSSNAATQLWKPLEEWLCTL